MSTDTESFVVLTAVGRDRTGIVDEVSAFLSQRNCNLEDSRMAVLGGEFAIIALASGDAEAVACVESDYPQLANESRLSVTVKQTSRQGMLAEGSVAYRLVGTSLDHVGIVHRVSHLLSRCSINIRRIDTKAYAAPTSGAPMFHFEMELDVPAAMKLPELRKELLDLADQENIDLELHPVTP